MVAIYLRPGQAIPQNVALCDPTVPCTETVIAWGYEPPGPFSRPPSNPRRESNGEPLPSLANWGYESQSPRPHATLRTAFPRSDSLFVSPLPLVPSWGWEPVSPFYHPVLRTAFPRGDAIFVSPLPLLLIGGWLPESPNHRLRTAFPRGDALFASPLPIVPIWGWEQTPLRPKPYHRVFPDAPDTLAALANWGWEPTSPHVRSFIRVRGFYPATETDEALASIPIAWWEASPTSRPAARPFFLSTDAWVPFEVSPEPPGPPRELPPVAYPSTAGGGAGGMLIDPAYEISTECDPDDPDPYMVRICDDVPDDFDDPLFRDDAGFLPSPPKPAEPKPKPKKPHAERPFAPNRYRIVVKASKAAKPPAAVARTWWTAPSPGQPKPLPAPLRLPSATTLRILMWLLTHFED